MESRHLGCAPGGFHIFRFHLYSDLGARPARKLYERPRGEIKAGPVSRLLFSVTFFPLAHYYGRVWDVGASEVRWEILAHFLSFHIALFFTCRNTLAESF